MANNPLDDLIDAGTRALSLPLDPAWKASVRANLAVTLKHGEAVAEFPLPDEAEPAPIFRA